MFDRIRFLLLQVRNPDDPMRLHEVQAFARALRIVPEQIAVFDLLSDSAVDASLRDADMFLLGGSGKYSAAGQGEWLDRALDVLRRVHETRKPTFASCWGFQAMARAMGGRVINDRSWAEVGTHSLTLTDAGRDDPVFGPLGDSFLAQMGHEDHVVELPTNTTLLASSKRAVHQAYRFDDRPIYCTQFHPELTGDDLQLRVQAYPEYIEEIAKVSYEEFVASIKETPGSEALLRRFVEMCFAEV